MAQDNKKNMVKLKNLFHYGIATALGTGYFPKAPGTAGSLFAILILYLFTISETTLIFLIILFTVLGIWTATVIENKKGSDPSIVVIDEVVGQWISLLYIPFTTIPVLLAFILFRFFDIYKPFPIDQSQKLKGGYGIMVDDIIAGIYSNLVIQLILYFGLI